MPRRAGSALRDDRLDWLKLQHMAGIDGIGVADQGLDARDAELPGPGGERRARPRLGIGPHAGRFVERPRQAWPAAGPAGAGLLTRSLQDHLQPQHPARRDGGRVVDAARPHELHLARAEGLHEIMGRLSDAALWLLHGERFAHRPVEPGPGIGQARPDPFVQAAQHHQVGPHETRFQEAQDGEPRGARIARPAAPCCAADG